MWKLYEGRWIRGRRGAAILRELLLHRSPAEALSESDLEDLMVELLKDGSFPPWTQQYPMRLSFGPIRIDFAYPAVKLAIECDSYMWHMDEEAFRRDRRRDAELQAMGWIVLRFTWRQIKFERGYVQSQIRRVLERRSA
jgi:very-short-patch-repair endonuclease